LNFLSSAVNSGVKMETQKYPIVDRREEPPERSVWWSKLSLAQKFSASSLGKFGYELCFVRNNEGRSLAVLMCNSGVAVITEDGDINTSPDIKIR
jgi:hypothetical protein